MAEKLGFHVALSPWCHQANERIVELEEALRSLLREEYREHFYGQPGDPGYRTEDEWIEQEFARLTAPKEEP